MLMEPENRDFYKRILITGGCGFIGHHFIEHILKHTNWEVIVIDKLSYAANGFNRVKDIQAFDNDRCKFFTCDLSLGISNGVLYEIGFVDYIVHMAAETHVDNSIADPNPFVMSNVIGTYHILEVARRLRPQRFIYFSTDEVFGPAKLDHYVEERWIDMPSPLVGRPCSKYCEWDRYRSSNPYSATKAAGEELTVAYANTYGLPCLVTHTVNCFGERQHPEKYIPLIIKKVLAGEEVQIHRSKVDQTIGSRFYIHCRNVADALLFLLDNYREEGIEKFNITSKDEVDNLKLAMIVADLLNKHLHYKLVDCDGVRPGHDLRYALDGRKLEGLGWVQPIDFQSSLEKTVKWTLENRHWLNF